MGVVVLASGDNLNGRGNLQLENIKPRWSQCTIIMIVLLLYAGQMYKVKLKAA